MAQAFFSIQRRGAPRSARRFLAIDNDGSLAWAEVSAPFNVFQSERAAEAFREFRMGRHAADGFVASHTVH